MFFKDDFTSKNVSMNLELIGNVIQNENFSHQIIDHPMKPFGMRYWQYPYWDNSYKEFLNHNIPDYRKFYRGIDDFLERSPQICSWLRDQEYLVDFKLYEDLEFKDGNVSNYLDVFPKVRFLFVYKSFELILI